MVGHVERKDDNDWVKHSITWELKALDREDARKRPGGIVLRMSWTHIQKDALFKNKWRRSKGQLANPGLPGQMAVKTKCVYFVQCTGYSPMSPTPGDEGTIWMPWQVSTPLSLVPTLLLNGLNPLITICSRLF